MVVDFDLGICLWKWFIVLSVLMIVYFVEICMCNVVCNCDMIVVVFMLWFMMLLMMSIN